MRAKKILFVLLLMVPVCLRAQNIETITNKIDSLVNIGLPKSALAEVDKLDNLARKTNNTPQQVKAAIYRMTLQSYLEENALVAIIATLKTEIKQADVPVKPVLQSVLANMYWQYYQQNRYQFYQRTTQARPDADFTKWDLRTIINETRRLYSASLSDPKREQATPVSVLDGVLKGDEKARYLRPTLYDLLVNRALDFYLAAEPNLPQPRLPFNLNDPRFFGDSRAFINLAVTTTDTTSLYYQGIKYLQQVSLFHLQRSEQDALADIDLKRLQFVYQQSTIVNKDELYLKALDDEALRLAASPMSADVLVLQAQYAQQKDNLVQAEAYLEKAITTYPESFGAVNARVLLKDIKQQKLSASIDSKNVPAKPLLALISYRNIKAARVLIYRLSERQFGQICQGNNLIVSADSMDKITAKLMPIQQQQLDLPGTADYRPHTAEFSINPLPTGNYIIVVKDTTQQNTTVTGFASFKVSGLTYVSRQKPGGDHEVVVMDSRTGAPLKDVLVHVFEYSKGETSTGPTDINGSYHFSITDNRVDIALTYGSDTLTDKGKYIYNVRPNVMPDIIQTVLFTDRQIYRPGQTIYFKAIQMVKQQDKSRLLTGESLDIKLKDGNNKELSSLQLRTNEFGSVAGSFIIPQKILNGNISLSTPNGAVYIRVEEYKRPTFAITFLPIKESYKPGDSVAVKGNVKAFSGYGLTNARVAYHITRTVTRMRPYYFDQAAEVKADTIQTSPNGDFTIKFKADEVDINHLENIYSYEINADITDASGETHSGHVGVKVGKNNIILHVNIPSQLFTTEAVRLPANLTNLNGQKIKGYISVQVYALQSPKQLYADRLWQLPDQHLLDSVQFIKQFPEYAYHNENMPAQYKVIRRVADISQRVTDTTNDTLKLDILQQQASGMYKVVIKDINDSGDTTSVTEYTKLIGAKAKAERFNEWVVPVSKTVVPGGNAEFLVGINQKCYVLVEAYDKDKVIFTKRLTIEEGQQRIAIPIPVNAGKNIAVQFLMAYNNHTYSSYQPLDVKQPSKQLDMKFLTFHDKLLPGQKEEWKIQVTGAEKETAEMVAGLYDASLDDVSPAQTWGLNTYNFNYNQGYYRWETGFNTSNTTRPLRNYYYRSAIMSRQYEQLDLFNYSYYGGYNYAYRNYLNQVAKARAIAELVKGGYEISGKVVDSAGLGLPGVSVTIKNTSIGTITNSMGTFNIKVPVKAVLVFNYIGYLSREISTAKAGTLNVELEQAKNELNEVSVIGYGTQTRMDVTGSVASLNYDELVDPNGGAYLRKDIVVLRELKTIPGQKFSKIMIRGQMSEMGDLPADILDKIQVVDDYGDQAGLTGRPITLRANFNETAFFYPQLRTDEKGQVLIEFTIPEALTQWHFRALAHTQDLKTGYLEGAVVTQKQLSISANMPRFLREGDTVTISARLANLTRAGLTGKVELRLFNALNMQPVNLLVNPAAASKVFDLKGATTQAVSFKLVVPKGLDALNYRLTADAGTFSDGEENTIPVLPNRMLVTESMPMMIRPGQTRSFTFDKLVNQHSTTLQNKSLTLEFTQNPAWYAVQALPYMMEYPYECSEQIFSRYYANSLATNLVNTMPVIKKVFDQWKSVNSTELLSNLEKNQELKSTLIEETPWLRDAINEDEQKKRIALLFDLNKMNNELDQNLDKLQKNQLGGGSFPWFGGDKPDRFITQHILEGIGQLYHLNIVATDTAQLRTVANNGLNYMENELTDDYNRLKKQHIKLGENDLSAVEIHGWFVRSYYTHRPLTSVLKPIFDDYIKRTASGWKFRSIYEQGMIALTMLRNNREDVAKMIERSLLETAQQSDEMGMYWGKNHLGYFWYQSPVETQCLLIELFTEAGNIKAVDEMKIWLLREKQTNNWKTTKATAAACYALLLRGSDWLADQSASSIKLNNQPIEQLKPGIKADEGTGYFKTTWVDEQVKPELGKVSVNNTGKTINWGAMYWQYLENLDKITPSTTDIQLGRKYFIQKQTDNGPLLIAVDATHQPKVGDLLKVVVNLKAGRDYEY
ncbi:MAG: alpha-2-macroglobulin family protein, partial [Mucilaginibacter sp.]